MRYASLLPLLAAALLLAGCVSENAGPAAPNVSVPAVLPNATSAPNTTAAQNITLQENVSANLTPIMPPANATANETIPAPQYNATGTNQTQNLTGILFGEGRYLLVIEDMTVPDGEACALMSVAYASNSSVITKLDICPGESQNWVSPEGRVFRIAVYKTAAGYTGAGKWAQVAIYG